MLAAAAAVVCAAGASAFWARFINVLFVRDAAAVSSAAPRGEGGCHGSRAIVTTPSVCDNSVVDDRQVNNSGIFLFTPLISEQPMMR